MEGIISRIMAVVAAVKGIDWGAFFIWWLGIERVLRAISKLTAWTWDDDLVEWMSKLMPRRK